MIFNGVYSGFKSYHYFNDCACALCGLLLSACPRSASNNSINTHQNENRFVFFCIQKPDIECRSRKCNDFCLYHSLLKI